MGEKWVRIETTNKIWGRSARVKYFPETLPCVEAAPWCLWHIW
jgi:hypothetical protein